MTFKFVIMETIASYCAISVLTIFSMCGELNSSPASLQLGLSWLPAANYSSMADTVRYRRGIGGQEMSLEDCLVHPLVEIVKRESISFFGGEVGVHQIR